MIRKTPSAKGGKILLPSEKLQARKKHEKDLQKQAQEREDSLRGVVRRVASTGDGVELLRWMRKECGFGEPILGAVAGQIDERVTVYNAMRLNLYLQVRKLLTIEMRNEVEHD